MDVEFTITFLKLLSWAIYLMAPLLAGFVVVIVLLGQVVTRLENWSKFDGVYWSFITAGTVGYGDFRPSKKISKVLSIIIAILGMMLTGLIISLTLTSATIAFEKHINPDIIEHIKNELSLESEYTNIP